MKSLYETTLTGTKMSQLGKLSPDSIVAGTMLSIHARPDNAYDSQAMSVHFGFGVTDPQVGWVPAKFPEDQTVKGVLFNIVRHGFTLVAQVVNYEPATRHLRVAIGIVDEDDASASGFDDEGEDDIPGTGDDIEREDEATDR